MIPPEQMKICNIVFQWTDSGTKILKLPFQRCTLVNAYMPRVYKKGKNLGKKRKQV